MPLFPTFETISFLHELGSLLGGEPVNVHGIGILFTFHRQRFSWEYPSLLHCSFLSLIVVGIFSSSHGKCLPCHTILGEWWVDLQMWGSVIVVHVAVFPWIDWLITVADSLNPDWDTNSLNLARCSSKLPSPIQRCFMASRASPGASYGENDFSKLSKKIFDELKDMSSPLAELSLITFRVSIVLHLCWSWMTWQMPFSCCHCCSAPY